MKPIVKGIIAGLIIIAIGVVILIIALGMNGWKFSGFTVEYETRTFDAEQENDSLAVNMDAGILEVKYYDGERIKVEYPFAEEFQTELLEENGKLTVTSVEHFKKYLFMGNVLSCIPATKIYLPQNVDFNIELNVKAGTADIASGKYGEVTVNLDAGTVNFENVECTNCVCKVDAGTLKAEKLICDKTECSVDAGTLKILNLSCPQIKAEVNAGTMDLQVVGNRSEYDVTATVSMGTFKINGAKVGGLNENSSKDKKLQANVDLGTLKIYFTSAN